MNRIMSILILQRSFSKVVAAPLKPATDLYKTSRIVDKIRLHVRGGSGGQGSPSTGGVGADGGHVFIKCAKGASLNGYRLKQNRRIFAQHGSHYQRGRMSMKPAKNAFILVPPGTEVKTGDNVLIHDMNNDGEIMKIATGGKGGSAKTTDFNGIRGERKNITLELKTIADVSLTGFPNAGKSSLLRQLSRARPKVGNYPFTTISPMVGSILYTDGSQILVADLPGLIEDAHLNKGMGHRFLRHTERTNAIVLVIDVNGFQLKSTHPYRSPIETVILLIKELLLYKDMLITRPLLMVLNKMDTNNSETKREELFRSMLDIENNPLIAEKEYKDEIVSVIKRLCNDNFESVISLSATDGTGVDNLKNALYLIVPPKTGNDTVDLQLEEMQ